MGAISYYPLSNAKEFVTTSLTDLQGLPFFGFTITLPPPVEEENSVFQASNYCINEVYFKQIKITFLIILLRKMKAISYLPIDLVETIRNYLENVVTYVLMKHLSNDY